ncbi:MAG: PepSY domain-containing protein [Thermoguttaceae bacterium]|nr:PepSY domain-containing protein [Thermoguttaceae bacterium]
MKFAPLRRFFYELHLWLGLVSGLILFVVCLSGSLYVFRNEARQLAAPEFFNVATVQEKRLSADEIVAKVEAARPGKKVGSLTIPESPTRTVAVVLNDAPSKGERGQGAGPGKGQGQGKRQGPRDGSGRGQGRGEGQGLRDGSGIDQAPHNAGQGAGPGKGQGQGKRQGPRDGSGRGQGRGEGQGLRDGSGVDKAPQNAGQGAGRGNGQGGGKGGGGKRRGETVYVDPYTGEIVGEGATPVDEFFGSVMRLHRFLWLPTEIGRPIVGVATIIYVVISLTGLLLWLPRTAAAWRRKSTWKTALNVRVRRGGWPLVFDLHNALGFYTLVPALILALTGLCWSFGWYRDAAGSLLGEAPFKAKSEKPEAIGLPDGSPQPASLEDLIAKHNKLDPGAGDVTISLPQDPETTATTIEKGPVGGFFALNVKNKTQWNRPDGTVVSVERYGKMVEVERFADKPFGAKIASSIRALHLGEITGLSSKIFFFVVCLIATSFPATGVALWVHKLRARNKKEEAQADAANAEKSPETDANAEKQAE